MINSAVLREFMRAWLHLSHYNPIILLLTTKNPTVFAKVKLYSVEHEDKVHKSIKILKFAILLIMHIMHLTHSYVLQRRYGFQDFAWCFLVVRNF